MNAINRDFYAAEASSSQFSATRDHAWPGWERLWDAVEAAAALQRGPARRTLSVLDAGCGNGRFAAFLAGREPATIDSIEYLGIDASEALLEIAAQRASPLAHARLLCRDLVEDAAERLDTLDAGAAGFDVVVLIGVLHHIPSFEARAQLLATLTEHLAPGGMLALTIWRFAEKSIWPRFQRRVLPWKDYNRDSPNPLDLAQLEAGDHLLLWGTASEVRASNPAGPLRYCHNVDPAERDALLAPLPLERLDHYTEDGRSKDLNEYVLLRRKP